MKNLSLVILAAFSFVCISSKAQANSYFRCVKVFSTMQEDHSFASVSRSRTLETLAELRFFRARELNGFDRTQSNKTVQADHRSSKRKKAAVTRRLSQLLDSKIEKNGTIELGVDENIQLGSTFRGKDEILNHLARRREIYHSIKTNDPDRFKIAVLDGMSKFFGLILPTAATTALVGIGGVGILTLPIIFDHPKLLGLYSLAAFFGYVNRGLIESAYRLGSRSWSHHDRSEQTIERSLDKLKPKEWIFRSLDVDLPASLLDRMQEPDPDHFLNFLDFLSDSDYPEKMIRLTGRNLMISEVVKNMRDKNRTQRRWIRIDELLTKDSSGQLKFFVFLRTSRNLPPIPIKTREKEPVFNSKPVRVPVEIGS